MAVTSDEKENKSAVALRRGKKADKDFMPIEQMQKLVTHENKQDDWFDRSDAVFSVALGFLAMCALLKNKWLYFSSVGLGLTATVLMMVGDYLPAGK